MAGLGGQAWLEGRIRALIMLTCLSRWGGTRSGCLIFFSSFFCWADWRSCLLCSLLVLFHPFVGTLPVRVPNSLTHRHTHTGAGDDPDLACGHDSDCINRLTQVECMPDDCRCKSYCRNQRFVSSLSSPSAQLGVEKGNSDMAAGLRFGMIGSRGWSTLRLISYRPRRKASGCGRRRICESACPVILSFIFCSCRF